MTGASLSATGLSPAVESASSLAGSAASIPSASGSLLTCRNCAVDRTTCPRRAQVRAGIKGLGLTAIKFRCEQRRPLYHEGQRVSVTWLYYPPDCEWEREAFLETWPATVIGESNKGFLIVVDDVDSDGGLPARAYVKNDTLYCNVTSSKLKPLAEPDRAVCAYCRNAENADGEVPGCFDRDRDQSGMPVIPTCLASAIEARRAETQGGSVHESAGLQGDAQTPSSQHPLNNNGDSKC